MKKFLVVVFSCIWVFTKGQDFKLELVGQWHNANLPAYGTQVYNDIWGWEDENGREYVILGSIDSTYFIEVTFPEKPVVRDVVAGMADSCIHRDFKTFGKYCYGVADEGNSSLQIFDLSYLPDSVHKVYDSDELTRRSHNIFIADGKAYLASNLHKEYGFIPMTVLDLEKNAEKPYAVNHLGKLIIDETTIFSHVHDVFVRDNRAFCSNGSGGLFIYDVSNNQLKLIGTLTEYPDQGYNHSSWLTDDSQYLVMADETHGMRLKMVDIKDLNEIKVLGAFGSNSDKGSIPHNPFVLGDKCFVSYYHEGLVVFDISNPSDITIADKYDTYPDNNLDTTYKGYEGCWGAYPYFSSGIIAASDMTYGLFLFKTGNWQSPLKKRLEKKQVFSSRLSQNMVLLNFDEAYNGSIKLEIFDAMGKLIEQNEIWFTGFQTQMEFQNLAQGLYVIHISTLLGTETIKTLKVENY